MLNIFNVNDILNYFRMNTKCATFIQNSRGINGERLMYSLHYFKIAKHRFQGRSPVVYLLQSVALRDALINQNY